MAKVVFFEWVSLGGVDYYTGPKGEEDYSGEYIPLADYEAAIALLKRWDKIAPGISWIIDDSGHRQDLVDKIEELIQDTSEALT